jgi:hypothetical protein
VFQTTPFAPIADQNHNFVFDAILRLVVEVELLQIVRLAIEQHVRSRQAIVVGLVVASHLDSVAVVQDLQGLGLYSGEAHLERLLVVRLIDFLCDYVDR